MRKKTSWCCNVVLILMLLLCNNSVCGKGVISDANEQLRHIIQNRLASQMIISSI